MENYFTESDLAAMKVFYQRELQETLNKLEHIKSVLSKLDSSAPKIDIFITGAGDASALQVVTPIANSVKAKKIKRKTRKKTGPKAIWGEFIINKLKELNRPLTYEELIDEAIKHFKTPAERTLSTRQAVINSAFRLRKHHGEVETVAKKGQKEKYLCLIDWFKDDGELKSDYSEAIGI